MLITTTTPTRAKMEIFQGVAAGIQRTEIEQWLGFPSGPLTFGVWAQTQLTASLIPCCGSGIVCEDEPAILREPQCVCWWKARSLSWNSPNLMGPALQLDDSGVGVGELR